MVLLGALALSVSVAVSVGAVSVPLGDVWGIIWHRLTGADGSGSWPAAHEQIVWQIRLPRVVLGVLVGAGLSVVGVAIQAMVRNPLADPYVLGVSSGAAVGAVSVIVLGVGASSRLSTSAGAFAGALVTAALVFALARSREGALSPVRLLLVGVAFSYALSGATSFFLYSSNDQGLINQILFWILGGLSGATWRVMAVPAIAVGFACVYMLANARALNALILGDENASALGIDPQRLRRRLFVVTAAVLGALVAVAGQIGFVGLVVPHVARLLGGADHRRALPLTIVVGAAYLVWVDVAARMTFAPSELPIGVVTSMIGAPIFVALVLRNASALRRAA